jgi:glycerophosphoryl diester phosphodiesterase
MQRTFPQAHSAKLHRKLLLFCTIFSSILFAFGTNAYGQVAVPRHPVDPPAPLVAHGAGAIQVETQKGKKWFHVTNTLEALERNYQAGHTLFEMDFEWTADKHLVPIHDWDKAWRDFFSEIPLPPPNRAPSLKDFKEWKMHYGFTQLTPQGLFTWLKEHPGAYIISDIKKYNADGMKYLIEVDPEIAKNRIIPQLMRFSDYEVAKSLGYKRIILTLYQLNKQERSDEAVLEFVKSHKLYAVTMPVARAMDGRLAIELEKLGTYVYAHSVVDKRKVEKLKKRGVQGVYSYSLLP